MTNVVTTVYDTLLREILKILAADRPPGRRCPPQLFVVNL
jgi:hypothetical protein